VIDPVLSRPDTDDPDIGSGHLAFINVHIDTMFEGLVNLLFSTLVAWLISATRVEPMSAGSVSSTTFLVRAWSLVRAYLFPHPGVACWVPAPAVVLAVTFTDVRIPPRDLDLYRMARRRLVRDDRPATTQRTDGRAVGTGDLLPRRPPHDRRHLAHHRARSCSLARHHRWCCAIASTPHARQGRRRVHRERPARAVTWRGLRASAVLPIAGNDLDCRARHPWHRPFG
jgi:hypothetical protein